MLHPRADVRHLLRWQPYIRGGGYQDGRLVPIDAVRFLAEAWQWPWTRLAFVWDSEDFIASDMLHISI